MKIQNKLFIVLFGFSLTLVAMLVLLVQWSIGKGMINYVNTKEVQALQPVTTELAKEYSHNNNWSSMQDEHYKFRYMVMTQLRKSGFIDKKHMPPQGRFDKRPMHWQQKFKPPINKGKGQQPFEPSMMLKPSYAVLDINNNLIVGRYEPELDYTQIVIQLNDVAIGYLAVAKRNQLTQGYEIDFIEQQQNYLWIIAVFAMCLVTLVTLPLSRHLVEPIKLISRSMHQLTQGNFKQSVQIKRKDELGQMARDYNDLALTLSENDTARKRWLANISHELRTPVAILRGEIEAMLDDVRALSKQNLSSANDEVKHLQRLIDDLNLMTSADIGGMRYKKQNHELVSLITAEQQKYQGYLANSGINLQLELGTDSLPVYLDKTRIYQLFENIINNCIKYSAATELTISLSQEQIGQQPFAVITFADNGIGVEDQHLAHLFEHLYRVDASRNRKTGGVGLGLAICKLIVEAHQGEIIAQHSAQAGLAIVIKLPMDQHLDLSL